MPSKDVETRKQSAPAKEAAPSGPRFQAVVHHHGRTTVETHDTAEAADKWATAYARDVDGTFHVVEV